MTPLSLADQPLFGLPLVSIWYVVVFFTLAMFLVLDGFDFGVGMLFRTRAAADVRDELLAAVGPVWDGNEVWLIVFGGGLFAVFPAAYAGLFSRHYLLMFGILGGLILRGAAVEFYEERHDARWQRAWGWAFSAGSFLATFMLGMFTAAWLLGTGTALTLPGVVVGLALVALTVAEGAAFAGTKLPEMPPALSRYGRYADAAYLALTVVTVGYVFLAAPALRPDLLTAPAVVLVLATAVLAGAYYRFSAADRHLAALLSAGGQAFALVALVAYLLHPSIDPAAGLAADAAAVSTLQLNLMSVMAAVFLPLVLVYFVVLYRAFWGPVEEGAGYGG